MLRGMAQMAEPIGNAPPEWCMVQAEELRKYVREHDAEDSEAELAWALWEASKR